MLVWTDVSADARVQREARTLAEAGHRVHIVGRAVAPDYSPPPGVTVVSAGRAPAGAARRRRLPAPLRAARWLLLPEHIKRQHRRWLIESEPLARAASYDVVHAHDFTALSLGAKLAVEKQVPLIYDSHEFWPGRDRHGRPTPLLDRGERRAEKALGDKAAAVITVGPELAGLLQSAYGWNNITVVRNTFPLTGEAKPPAGPPTAAVYAGRIGAGRDLETVVAAAAELSPLDVVLLGPADGGYLAGLPTDRVEVRDALPLDDATELVRRGGIALVTLSDRWLNNRIGMPNKLFMAVNAGVPVVASDLPALRRLVTEHDIGALYRPGDTSSFVAAVRDVQQRYDHLLANVSAARSVLSWQTDAQALLAVYAGLPAASAR